MMCPECSATPGYYIDQSKCERCGRRIIKRERSKMILYRILELFRFHKHDYKIINQYTTQFKPHGEFTVRLYMCSNKKCMAREWTVTGFIDNIENWEREQGLI